MYLSKIVPQHVHRQDFTWLKRDFTVMSPGYRRIRAKVGGGMEKCDWCGHEFADDEVMALAGRPKGRNWVLCQTCAEMAEKGPGLETPAVPCIWRAGCDKKANCQEAGCCLGVRSNRGEPG
jgi:hypothetical protein